MTYSILLCLFLLQIKHFFFDFGCAIPAHVKYQGDYGNILGFNHSALHGAATLLILLPFFEVDHYLTLFCIAVVEAIIHYHIDWLTALSNEPFVKEKFWVHLGWDQFAHQLTYMMVIFAAFGLEC